MKNNSIFVVYRVKKNDLDEIEIFANHKDAKRYVEEQAKKGIKLSIWERPIR